MQSDTLTNQPREFSTVSQSACQQVVLKRTFSCQGVGGGSWKVPPGVLAVANCLEEVNLRFTGGARPLVDKDRTIVCLLLHTRSICTNVVVVNNS